MSSASAPCEITAESTTTKSSGIRVNTKKEENQCSIYPDRLGSQDRSHSSTRRDSYTTTTPSLATSQHITSVFPSATPAPVAFRAWHPRSDQGSPNASPVVRPLPAPAESYSTGAPPD